MGACLSVLNFLRVIFIDGNSASVALTICVAMLIIVVIAKTIGRSSADGRKSGGNRSALMAGPVVSSADRYVFSGDLLPVRYDDFGI